MSMMTSCSSNRFKEVVLMDKHTCTVHGYLECASHAVVSWALTTFARQTDMRVLGHKRHPCIVGLKEWRTHVLFDSFAYHGLCPGAEDHPGDHLLGC